LLKQNYSEKDKVEVINLSAKNLKGRLDLTGYKNLKELRCYNNELTELDLSDCLELKRLDCSNNQLRSLDVSKNADLIEIYCSDNSLTSINLPTEQKNNLEELDLRDNNFSQQDLSFLESYTALEKLYLGNENN